MAVTTEVTMSFDDYTKLVEKLNSYKQCLTDISTSRISSHNAEFAAKSVLKAYGKEE